MSSPTCYFPDGVVDVESIACDPSAPVSSCCLPGDNCMSNGLCNNGGTDLTSIVRNSCTDSSWASLSCPQYCVGGAISGGYGDNSLGSSNVLFECSNEPSHYYCDGVNADTDCSGGGIYDFTGITEGGPPGQMAMPVAPSQYSPPVQYTTTLVATFVTTAPGTTAPQVTQAPVTITNEVTATRVVTSIQSPIATIPTTAPTATVSSDRGQGSRLPAVVSSGTSTASPGGTALPVVQKSSSNAAAIGGGVGGGVGALLLLGILAFFLIRRRNKTKKKAAENNGYEGGSNNTPYTSAPATQSHATPYPYGAAPIMSSPKSAMSSPSELKEETAPMSRTMSPDLTGNTQNTQNSWSNTSDGRQSWAAGAAPIQAGPYESNPNPVPHELSGEQPAYMQMSAANEMYAGLPPAELSGGQNTFQR